MNWSELPDLLAVALLACAFASVARRSPTPESGIWLTGWVMIVLHFAAFLLMNLPGSEGVTATVIGMCALVWAALLFTWSAVPYRKEPSSRWIFGLLTITSTTYIILNTIYPIGSWALTPVAALMGICPVVVTLAVMRHFNPRLRWILVSLYAALSIYVVMVQHRLSNGNDLAANAVLFTVYFGCCAHFWFTYRRSTAGAFITIAGFAAWAAVFVLAPLRDAYWPTVTIESEVWNLPKYVVAVGMILLLLEDQIEHTKYLAQHDHLTGLANRRFFQDKMEEALEIAGRTQTQVALLVVDLDQFKQVNDTRGHHVGDQVLKRVADLFLARVRRTDTVARTGGDEFSIILVDSTDREKATAVARSLIQLLADPILLDDGISVKIGASVGIAVYPDDAKDLQTLCIEADLRMYDSKFIAVEAPPTGGNSSGSPFQARSNDAGMGDTRNKPRVPHALRRSTDR